MEEPPPEDQSGSFDDYVSGIESHFKGLLGKASLAPRDAYEHWAGDCAKMKFFIFPFLIRSHFQAFTHAIDWKERWLQGLIFFEILLFILVIFCRNSFELQSLVFFIICALVYLSERLNTFCSQNWERFATQNYFDEHGSFAVTMFSGPLLFIGFVQVVSKVKLLFTSFTSLTPRSM